MSSSPEARSALTSGATSSSGTHIRRATSVDAELLLSWRNDPSTRAMFNNSQPVSRDDHYDWLRRVLADPDRLLLVAEADGRPSGTVRFDRADDEWHTSITVAPEARGRGMGKRILAAAIRELRKSSPGAPIFAEVKAENLSSAAVFESCGFERMADMGGMRRYFLR